MQQLICQLEAILFVAGRSLGLRELIELTGKPVEDVTNALELLSEELSGRGVRLCRSGDSYELISAPEQSELVGEFMRSEATATLSRPALEVLAIITHHQPTTKQEVDEARGIASDQTLKNLLGRGLIKESGRRAEPGRPPEYAITTELLQWLGVESQTELKQKLSLDAH